MALCYPCINLSFLFSASILRAVIWRLKACNLSTCNQLPNVFMLGFKYSRHYPKSNIFATGLDQNTNTNIYYRKVCINLSYKPYKTKISFSGKNLCLHIIFIYKNILMCGDILNNNTKSIRIITAKLV